MSRTELWISGALRGGVLLSAAVVLAGGMLYLARNTGPAPSYSRFVKEGREYRVVEGIVRKAGTGGGRGLIQLGVLLLVATPVMRVALSLFLFLKQKDWVYIGVTILVLATLVYSLFFAPR